MYTEVPLHIVSQYFSKTFWHLLVYSIAKPQASGMYQVLNLRQCFLVTRYYRLWATDQCSYHVLQRASQPWPNGNAKGKHSEEAAKAHVHERSLSVSRCTICWLSHAVDYIVTFVVSLISSIKCYSFLFQVLESLRVDFTSRGCIHSFLSKCLFFHGEQ